MVIFPVRILKRPGIVTGFTMINYDRLFISIEDHIIVSEPVTAQVCRDMIKHKLRVISNELRVTSY